MYQENAAGNGVPPCMQGVCCSLLLGLFIPSPVLQPGAEAICKAVAVEAPGEHHGLVSDHKGTCAKWQWQESRALDVVAPLHCREAPLGSPLPPG